MRPCFDCICHAHLRHTTQSIDAHVFGCPPPPLSPVSPPFLLQRFVLLFFLAKCSQQLIDILLIPSAFRRCSDAINGVSVAVAPLSLSLSMFLFLCVPCNSCSSCSHMGCCHCFDKYKQDDVDEIAVGLDLLQAQCRPPCLLISCTACCHCCRCCCCPSGN